jgi:hypothetical protein
MVRKNKVGRPKKKDKMVLYTFTILESHKKIVLRGYRKKDIDDNFRTDIGRMYNQLTLKITH